MPTLTQKQLDALDYNLQSSNQRPFMELMRGLTLGRPLLPEWKAAAELGAQAGLTTPGPALTPLGRVAANSFREYLFWEERNRQMPAIEEFAPENFAGLDVLEVGSGFGCNLLSLAPHARSVTGLDIEPLFAQLTIPLSKAAGIAPPKIVIGSADSLPFEDESFDAVLAIGSLQYTRVEVSVCEMTRVLRPGGRVLMILGHLRGFLVDHLFETRPSPVRFARYLVDAFTAVTYPWLGRLVSPADSPVHPTEGRMRAWMLEAGLDVERIRTIGNESLYIGRRGAPR